jgi:glyoxylase I family protein
MVTNTGNPELNIEFRLDHVAVSVSNLETSVNFYGRNFGFACERVIEMAQGKGKVAILKNASLAIEMFAYTEAVPLPDYRKDIDSDLKTLGVKHFALNVADISSAAAFLKRNGVEFLSEIAVGLRGSRRFFVKDPDGIAIEITESGSARKSIV